MGGGYLGTLAIKLTAEINELKERLAQGENLTKAFAAAAVAAFLAVGTAAFAAGLQIDDALDGIRISTGATGQAMAGLEDSFNRVFANVPSSAADASTAIAQLNVRTGQTGAGLENLSTQVLTLARITKSDLNATVTESTRLFASWGIEQSKQAGTLDMVLRASQQTGIGVGELLQTMVTAGPVFRAAGFDFATSAALLGTFEKAGVNGQRAIASLTAAFRFFGKEGIDAKKGVEQTIARIQELGPGAAASALGVKVFGRSAVDMIAAIQSGRLNVDALTASIASGSDTIMDAAKATDGFTETLAKLRNKTVQALEPFGTAMLGTFNTALTGLLAPSKALLTTLDLLAKAAIALAAAVTARLVVSFARSVAAKIADVVATQAALRANVQYTGAVAAQAQAQFKAATSNLNSARAAGTSTDAVKAQRGALIAVRTAHVQATSATLAHKAAIDAASISARLAAGSLNVLKGVLAFFGGALGLAVTVALTAISVGFFNAGKRARQAAADAKQAADDFRSALAGMHDATLTATFVQSGYTRAAIIGQIRANQAQMDLQEAEIKRLNEAGVRMPTQMLSGNTFVSEQQAELIRHTRALEHNRKSIEVLRAEERKYGQQVADASTELENRRRVLREMGDLTDIPSTGPLPWEGDNEDAKTAVELLQERVGLLMQVADAESATARVAVKGQAENSAALTELIRLYSSATAAIAGMGDATRLSPPDLKKYTDLLGIVTQIGERVATPKLARLTAQVAPKMVQGGVGTAFGKELADRLESITDKFRESLVLLGQIPIADKLERSGNAVREALKQGASDAADRLSEASENVRSMWSGLFSNLPQQLRDFVSMFNSLKEKRKEQQKALDAGVEGATGPTGLAPFPGAIAFMLAAEALAPVMEALREPMAALMIPIQMVAQAFGPLLTSLLKALFPIMKQFGIAVTYVAQVAGYVSGALLKVVGEIIRAVGSLIAKVPGLGEEGAAIKKFGKGLTDASKEMFEMARSMPGVREELRNLDWDEAMKRAAEGADRLAESLTNVPPIFDYLARRAQASRVQTPANPAPPPPPRLPTPAPTPAPGDGGGTVGGTETATVQVSQSFGQGSIVVIAQPHHNEKEVARQVVLELFRSAASNGGPTPLSDATYRMLQQYLPQHSTR